MDTTRITSEELSETISQSSTSSSPLPPVQSTSEKSTSRKKVESSSSHRKERRRKEEQNSEETENLSNEEDEEESEENHDISSTVTPSGVDSDENNSDTNLSLLYKKYRNKNITEFNSPSNLNLLSPAISPAFNLSNTTSSTAAAMSVMAPPPPHITAPTPPTNRSRDQAAASAKIRPTSSSDSLSSSDLHQQQQHHRRRHQQYSADYLKEITAAINIETIVDGLIPNELLSDNNGVSSSSAAAAATASASVEASDTNSSHPLFFEFILKNLECFLRKTAASNSQTVVEFNQRAATLIVSIRFIWICFV